MTTLPDLLAESLRKQHALLASIEAAAARVYDRGKDKASETAYLEAKIRIFDQLLQSVRWRT